MADRCRKQFILGWVAWIALTVAVAGQSVWETVSVPGAEAGFFDVASCGDVVVVASGAGEIFRSEGGVAFTEVVDVGAFIQGLACVDTRFFAVGAGGTILTSVDGGQTWDDESGATGSFLSGITSGGGRLVATGANGTIVVRSESGGGWDEVGSGGEWFLSSVAYGRGRWVTAGEAGAVLVSSDSVSWQSVESGTNAFLSDVSYGGGRFVAVGEGGIVIVSADGEHWTTEVSGVDEWLYGATSGNGDLVVVGEHGVFLRSSGEGSWEEEVVAVPGSGDLFAVSYLTGRFFSAGEGGTGGRLLSSTVDTVHRAITIGKGGGLVEEGGTIAVRVERSGSLELVATVELEVVGGAAAASGDLVLPVTLAIDLGVGELSGELLIPVTDDGVAEGFEFFCFALKTIPAGFVIGEKEELCVVVYDEGDADGDFLPDSWEVGFFGGTEGVVGSDDPDGDGNDNLRELGDGTDPTSGLSARYRIVTGGGGSTIIRIPESDDYGTGEFVAVVAIAEPGFEFLRWDPVSGVAVDRATNPAAFVITSDVELTAVMQTTLGAALDDGGRNWSTGGAAPWIGQTAEAWDGMDAAQAGILSPGGNSTLRATFPGPGLLSFRWKTDVVDGVDSLRLVVGGQAERSLSGSSGWLEESVAVPAGEVEVRWDFVRGGQDGGESDRAWVDAVEFLPGAGESYVVWQALKFTESELADPRVSGAEADFNGDGFSNGYDYLFGGDPRSGGLGSVPELIFVPGIVGLAPQLILEVELAHLPFVRWGIEASDDGVSWVRLSANEVILGENEGVRRLAVTDPSPESGRRLYRVVVDVLQ